MELLQLMTIRGGGMKRKGYAALALTFCMAMPLFLHAEPLVREASGSAYSVDDGSLLYTEQHFISVAGDHRRVEYRNPDGALIAEKQVDYSRSTESPDFSQSSYGGDILASVSSSESGVEIHYFRDGESERKQVPIRTPLVVDAGFDHFVRANWDELADGRRIEFYFPFASRQSLIEMRLQTTECEAEEGSCFLLTPANWLFRALSPAIYLAYEKDQRRLLRYRGLSNVETPQGKGLIVDIQFRYPEATAMPAYAGSSDTNSDAIQPAP